MTNSFVLLLTLGVVGLSTAPSKPSAQPDATTQPPPLARSQGIQPMQPNGYQSVLQRYFGPNFDESALCRLANHQSYIVQVLVVTLPDPSDPHLADAFDNYLGSVQLALANASYLLDQHWLPEVMRRKEQTKARLILSDLPQSLMFTQGPEPVGAITSVPAKTQPELLDEPGIMLFRRDHLQGGTPGELLFLLLVPETPTSGIRQAALRAAFDRAAALSCSELRSAGPTTIRIIGPSFSGAAASLARGIKDWTPPHKFEHKFDVVTGSATNLDTQTFLQRVATFSATVTPDEITKDFYQYLGQKFTPDRPFIAILKESNTAYGQGEGAARHERSNRRECTPSVPCILELNFPLHISQLGAEYEKARTQRAISALPENNSRLLSLNLLEQDEPSDVPPTMSGLTKYNADLSLLNNLMAIDRAHINVVGIQATDPRDELFLAQKIKHIVPDVQLFFMDSNLLFSHTAIANEMRGALVVARYPLFNLNQLWTPPRQISPRVQFVSGSSQGVYNAAIFQLRKLDRERKAKLAQTALTRPDSTPVSAVQNPFVSEQHEPECEPRPASSDDDGPRPLEYGEPFELDSSRPPLWVAMVGHYGIWPIGTLGPSGSLKQYVRGSKVSWESVSRYTAAFAWKDKPMPLVFPQGTLHVLATLLLLLIILWHAAHQVPRLNKLLAGEHSLVCAVPANISKDSRLVSGYAAVQLLGWQSLIAIYLTALAPILAPRLAWITLSFRGHADSMGWRSWVLLIGGLASVVTCILIVVSLYTRVPWKTFKPAAEAERSWFEWITLGFCCFAGGALLVLSALYFSEVAFFSHEATKVFLWIRSGNWLSGISPMLPLVFLGAAVYSTTWLNLYRLAVASINRDPELPDSALPLHELLPGIKSLQTTEDAADNVASGRLLVPWRWLILIAAPIVAAIDFINIRPSAESDLWTWLMRVLLGLLILGILHGLVLLVQLWRTINKTLDQLAGHPVLEVLKGMRKTLAAMVGLHSYAAAPRREQVLACQRAQLDALIQEPLPETAPLQPNSSLEQALRWAAKKLTTKAWLSEKGEWSRSAAQLIALELVRALARRIAVIRALIGILTIDALVLLVVTRIYPFQPHSWLSGLSWVLLLAVVIVSAWALVAMERNAVLSYVTGSEPGKVTWDASFVLHLALFVGLPLAALVAAHFPEIGGPIFESLQPLIRAAR